MLRAARSWSGPPPTLLMGQPRVTRYFYNDAGQLVRTETDEWTRRDVELMLALAEYEARVCPGCGLDRADTMKPENQFRYKGRQAGICHACAALDVVTTDLKHPHPGALTFAVDFDPT